MFPTPLLLVIFNRPHKTEKVMEVIRQLKPLHLYIAADGPRTDKPGEAALCTQTREIALQGIDWPCELKTLFQTENLGCGIGVATAISWFFEQVEEGIILEDDCLADQSFFEFCSVLLDRYRNNDKIMHIGGNNFQFGQTRGDGDYYYSFFSHNWGWASWKRAWKYYEYDIDNQKNTIQKIYRPQFKKNKAFLYFLDNRFNEVKMPQNHIWDIQWHFAIIKNKGISIIPNKNLVQNIGFGKDGTHTLEEEEWNTHNIAKQLNSFNSPSSSAIDHNADNLTMKELFKVEDKYNNFLSKKNEEKILKKKQAIFFIKKTLKFLLPQFFLKIVKKNKRNENSLGELKKLEEERILNLDRYVSAETFFLNKKILIVDNASYFFIKNELFNLEIYKFSCTNDKPYIIDCGANIGLSVIYFKKLYPDAEILAFEPDDKVFNALEFNINSFELSDVTLIRKACWSEETSLKFYSEGADGGRAAVSTDIGNIIEIKTIRLRDFLHRRVDFLKIDIEGAETRVIQDSADLLCNVDKIFVEYHSFVNGEQFLPEILTVLKNAGFRIHITAPGLTSTHPYIKLRSHSNMDNQLNIFAFRLLDL